MAQSSALRPRRQIAVVGGGVSGLACLWGLRDHDFDVHLYESHSRLGGHANTVTFDGCCRSVPVDTGFIAMNEKTYRKSLSLDDLYLVIAFSDVSANAPNAIRSRDFADVSFRDQLNLLLSCKPSTSKLSQRICHFPYPRTTADSNGLAHLSEHSLAKLPTYSVLGSGGLHSTLFVSTTSPQT